MKYIELPRKNRTARQWKMKPKIVTKRKRVTDGYFNDKNDPVNVTATITTLDIRRDVVAISEEA